MANVRIRYGTVRGRYCRGNDSNAHIAQSVEHFLGKEEVTGSNPVVGSRYGEQRPGAMSSTTGPGWRLSRSAEIESARRCRVLAGLKEIQIGRLIHVEAKV